MKKPCREERTGLRIELNNLSLFFFVLLISNEIYPQIPINGFCKLNSYKVQPGYNAIASLNYNNDSYTDLLLYNKNLKNYSMLTGNGSDEKTDEKKFNAPFEFSKLITIYSRAQKPTNYAYTSRKNREAGFFSISSSGKLISDQSYKFNSFPENVSAADLNANGSPELLISGSGFDGLSVLHFDQRKLNEIKIDRRKIFSDAVFVDLSNNGFKDIAAFNLLNNSINFYYNYGSLRFRSVRSIETGSRIQNLKATNLNLDEYEDIIFCQQSAIKIMYGDAISSYNSVVTVSTLFIPDKFITGDFNKDGKIDLAYINIKNSTLSLIFAKTEYEFYDEIVYLRRHNLADIIPYYSKFINGLAVVTSSGELMTVTNLMAISERVNLAVGVEPSSLNYFDNDDNGITDICYIDKYDNSLKLITRDNAGIPSNYYSVRLNDFHEEILSLNINPNLKSFYCYSEGSRLIEIIKVDFKTFKNEKISIYSPGDILDLKIKEGKNDEPRIYLSFKKQNKVETGYYQYKNFRFSFTNYPDVLNDVSNISIALTGSPAVFYWQMINGEIVLTEKNFSKGSVSPGPLLELSAGNRVIINGIAADILNNEKDYYFCYIETDNSARTVFSSEVSAYAKNEKENPPDMRIKEKKQLYFGEIKFNGLKKISVYLPEERAVKKIDFTKGGKNFSVSKILEADYVDRFFIKNMSTKDYHFVYTNNNYGCITIKQLK